MQLRKFLVLYALFAFALTASAVTYSIGHTYITVEVDEEGMAQVNQRYYLAFPTQEDVDAFANLKTTYGNNLESWSGHNPEFSIRFGGIERIKRETVSVSFVSQEDYYLEISYEVAEPVSRLIDERSRMLIYELNKWPFNPFLHGTDYLVPEGTFLVFILPSSSTVIEEGEIFNHADIMKAARPRLTLPGMLSVDGLHFRYIQWKAIAPQFSISLAISSLLEQSDLFALLAVVIPVALLILLLYFKRKKFLSKVEGFIMKNTEFELPENELR